MKRIGWFSAALLVGVFGSVLASGSAAAQDAACVYLEVGAGYAAKMGVDAASGAFHEESGTFPIGQHRCLSLTPLNDGEAYEVKVSAVLGNTVSCGTFKRTTSFTGPITFFANKGTTLNHKCYLAK